MTYILWIIGAGVLGFAISAFFSDLLKLSRRVFLIPYIVLIAAFLVLFFRSNRIDFPRFIARDWYWGLAAGLVVSSLMARNVLSQPCSQRLKGWALVPDLLWVGLAYGIIDGFFLNVVPAYAVFLALPDSFGIGGPLGWALTGILALAAASLVTLLYHLGYAEFRNRSMRMVLMGNAFITAAYIVSGNPLGAILSHAAMHVAAVLRGPETTLQLPPHRVRRPEA
jgi:hypothetical protein